MINLIVADDHVVLREALCEMLNKKGTFKVMAQATNGQELLDLLGTHEPDLIIMDIAMPGVDGVTALERLKAIGKTTPVLILSAGEGERNVRAALKAGAKGYLPKNVASEELEFAIESIMSGKTYLSPSITAPLMSAGAGETSLDNPLAKLSKREVEILKYLADGKPNRDIAKMLHISIRTVDTHRSNILRKLKLKTNAQLTKLAIANGVIAV